MSTPPVMVKMFVKAIKKISDDSLLPAPTPTWNLMVPPVSKEKEYLIYQNYEQQMESSRKRYWFWQYLIDDTARGRDASEWIFSNAKPQLTIAESPALAPRKSTSSTSVTPRISTATPFARRSTSSHQQLAEATFDADASRIAADDAFVLEVGQTAVLPRTYSRSRSLPKTPMRSLVPPPSAPTSATSQAGSVARTASPPPTDIVNPEGSDVSPDRSPKKSDRAKSAKPVARQRENTTEPSQVLESIAALRDEVRSLAAQLAVLKSAMDRLERGQQDQINSVNARVAIPLLQKALSLLTRDGSG